jgi:hypothetical protein
MVDSVLNLNSSFLNTGGSITGREKGLPLNVLGGNSSGREC